MDSEFNLDGIDWENIGPSSKSTRCKGRRSDLFSDLRRPLADVDTNREADALRCGAKESSAAAAARGSRHAPSKAARRRSSGFRRRSDGKLEAETTREPVLNSRADRGSGVMPGVMAASATVPGDGPVATRASPPLDRAGSRRSLTFEAPLGLSGDSEFADWAGDSFAVPDDATVPGPTASAANEPAPAAPAACTGVQTKRFADTCMSAVEEMQQAEQTKRRRSSSARQSRLLELPSSWDLDVGDGIVNDFLLLDAPFLQSRPRRSLRLRRKSLVGVTPSLADADVEAFAQEPGELSPLDHPGIDDCPKRSDSPDSFVSHSQAEAGARVSLQPAPARSAAPCAPPGDRDEDTDSAGHGILETAFICSPVDGAGKPAANCPRLGAIAEDVEEEEQQQQQSCCRQSVEPSPCSAAEGETESCSAGDQSAGESDSIAAAGRPRRRAASYQAQQQQPAPKRRRQASSKPPEAAAAPAAEGRLADGDSVALDADLVTLYTNKAYAAPALRPLETIYEQPAVWRGQEKVMSASRAMRSMTFDASARGKASQRRQKARQLGWRPLQPGADCCSRLEQRLRDLDRSMGEDNGCFGADGSRVPSTAHAGEQPSPRRRSSTADCDQLAAIKSLALT